MRCPSCGTRDLPVTAGAYRCCGIVTRPLFLPASAACYAAWWEAMDERLATRARIGRRIRFASRAAEPGRGPVIEADVMPSGFRAFPIPRVKVPRHKAAV